MKRERHQMTLERVEREGESHSAFLSGECSCVIKNARKQFGGAAAYRHFRIGFLIFLLSAS